MDFTELTTILNQASGFQLFRLRGAINRMLDDPHWVKPIRQRLQLGQKVEYFDYKENALQPASIVEFRRKQLLIENIKTGQTWLVPYVAINLDGVDVTIREKTEQGLGAIELKVGDIVGFRDRANRERSGQITRLNEKTVTLLSDGQRWRVSYVLLHRVMEGDAHCYTDVQYSLESTVG